jgi:hypothetical protein
VINIRDLNHRRISISEFFIWQLSIISLSVFLLWDFAGRGIASKLGFTLPANLFFTFTLIALVINIKILSRKIAEQKKQIQNLTEKIALKIEE